MPQEVIQPKIELEQIKLVWLLHFIWNIVSWGILWTVLVVVYMFITDNLQTKTKKTIYSIINFNVSFFIYMVISFILVFVLIWIPMLIIWAIIWFVTLVIWFIKHLWGDSYEYPLTIKFLK